MRTALRYRVQRSVCEVTRLYLLLQGYALNSSLDKPMDFVYPILDVEPYDGDTTKCTLDRGFYDRTLVSIRWYGINAPETRHRDRDHKAVGLAVASVVNEHLLDIFKYHTLYFESKEKPKYANRVIGDIFYMVRATSAGKTQRKRMSLCKWALRSGLVKEYTGGPRGWTTEELTQVRRVLERRNVNMSHFDKEARK